MSNLIHNNEKGMVLPLGLMFLAIIAILGTTAVIVTTTDLKIGSNYRASVQAFYIAEAGLARAEAELINDLNNDQDFSNGSYVTTSGTIALAYNDLNFNNNLFTDIPFGEGFYTIQLKNYPTSPENKSTIWVRSIGTGPNSSTATLECYLSAENISPWNNAIFAGGGGGVPITGNVVIAGSIHILGDGLASTTTVFSNQIGDCRNTNVGMAGALAVKFAGGTSSDLNAKFRVKNGRVNMSVGSADIGSSSSPFKGIYVTDGDDGDSNGVNDDIIGGDNAGAGQNLYADKGASSAKEYDLGDYNITLPSIDTAWFDDPDADPANCLDLTGITDQTGGPPNNLPSATDDGHPADERGLIAGDLELSQSYKPLEVTYYPEIEQYDGGDWESSTNGIRLDCSSSPPVLEIKGIVKVSSLNISNDITYSGRGTIYTTGTTLIDGNVLPKTGETYPTTTDALGVTTKNVFGVVSRDITLGDDASQMLLTGAYYTFGTATSSKQTELAGTIVCKNFNITAQVPSIWQVPSLSTNLPPGMPGSDAVWVFTDRTWREITEQ